MGISLRAYARLRGCNLSAVQKAIATKRITTLPDGSIDPERADQEWAHRTLAGRVLNRVQRQRAAAPVSVSPGEPGLQADPVLAYLRARAVKESYAARTAQLEYEERSGKLIQATRASEYAATFSAIVRDALMALPDRMSPMLAAVDDEKAIHRMLSGEVAAMLKKVNKAIADSGL